MLSAYIHIPFCIRKCYYCDFSSVCYDSAQASAYVDALCREIENRAEPLAGRRLRSVYFGGGTPTTLSVAQIVEIMGALEASFDLLADAEITIEANPGTVDEKSLRALRHLAPVPINRLSLGVQSFDDLMLKAIGRIHSADQAREAVGAARQAGFDNLSIDLIFALPRQSVEKWKESLDEAIRLQPEHISLYGLTVEPDTVFGELQQRGELPLPEEDDELAMFEAAINSLTAAGYEHYEISNFALPGFRSVHNQVYWRNEPSIGFGAAAASYLNGTRFSNEPNPQEYVRRIHVGESVVAAEETLSEEAAMGETMYVGLRMLEGIPFERFITRFGKDLRDVYKEQINELVALGLIELDDTRIRLTHKGLLIANQVFERFI